MSEIWGSHSPEFDLRAPPTDFRVPFSFPLQSARPPFIQSTPLSLKRVL
jgi:hypothetical protein